MLIDILNQLLVRFEGIKTRMCEHLSFSRLFDRFQCIYLIESYGHKYRNYYDVHVYLNTFRILWLHFATKETFDIGIVHKNLRMIGLIFKQTTV